MSGDDPQGLSRAQALAGLRAAGEATRLRILALLAAAGELNVKDLTQILGQSQPRISRHLKLMAEAGLIRRFREGSWVFFRLADSGVEATLARAVVASLDANDLTLARDRARATAVAKARAEAAQTYFKAHASEWDEIRALHVAEREVEAAMDAALGQGPFKLLVDLGTGTGRILELFGDRANRALGFDLNTVEFAVEDGVPYAIDFMNAAPDADPHSVGPDNFAWIVEKVAAFAVKKAQEPKVPLTYRWSSLLEGPK